MTFEFRLPDVGEGIGEGEILTWLVAEGDVVEEGDPLAEVSTDKVTIELPSPCAGRIVRLCHPERTVVPVGEVIVVLERDGDAPTEALPPAPAEAPAPPPTPPAIARLGRVVASPSTRRFALEQGVDLTTVPATGPGGRILRTDVEAALATSPRSVNPHAPVRGTGIDRTGSGPEREHLSGARAAAAKHMAASSLTAATATTTFEVFGDGLLELGRLLAPEAERRSVRLTPVALIAKCVATALAHHPAFNATVEETTGDLLLHPTVDLGVAVAAPTGLLVPVVRDAGATSVMGVAERITDLAGRARDGRLALEDLRGGTFTLSSTGGLERATILSATPLINLPQTAILWTSRIVDRPRVRDGALEAGPLMVCSLSFDHRYIDGAMATAFINDLASYLERPERALA
ncbi:MAG TPA: dihydrolipoamide acetyltransferase family protein [Iamia sp.]|nr:dihydrolipoamide acetyltransferase family protein [Iamia sp.]